MTSPEQTPDNFDRVARSVGYAARLDTSDAWLALPIVLETRLEPHQRAALAYAALRTLPSRHVALAASTALSALAKEDAA